MQWWDRVTEELAKYQADNAANLPGAVFGVQTSDDQRLIDGVGPGWDAGTICEIGSMTKPFVAAGLLVALQERGRLDIETPAHELPGLDEWSGDPLRRRIRLRHLLQHTSGLPHTRPAADWPATACTGAARPAADAPDLGPTSAWLGAPALTNELIEVDGECRPARTVDLEQVGRHVLRTYPVTADPPPGSEYAYSTVNHVLLARVLEHLTGRPVQHYLREKLFTPLAMDDSFFIAGPTGDAEVDARLGEGVTDEQRARIADFVLITKDGLFPPEIAPGPGGTLNSRRTGWRYVNPDGGMYSRVGDLLNFLVMLRDGGLFEGRRVLSEEIVRLLVTDQGHGHTMGFGYRTKTTPYGQSGGTVEHLGLKMTYFWYDTRPDDPMVGVFLSQRMPNFIANTDMSAGLRPIFRVFLPLVNARADGTPS